MFSLLDRSRASDLCCDAGSLRCGRHRPFALDHARSSQRSRETPSAET